MEDKPRTLKGYEKFQMNHGDIAKIKITMPCLLCGRSYTRVIGEPRVIGELCSGWCIQPMIDLVRLNRSFYG